MIEFSKFIEDMEQWILNFLGVNTHGEKGIVTQQQLEWIGSYSLKNGKQTSET